MKSMRTNDPNAGAPRHAHRTTCRPYYKTLLIATLLCGDLALSALSTRAIAGYYRVDTGDTLRIMIYAEEGFPIEGVVDDGGFLTLPLVGEVQARGLTTSELARQIHASLEREQYLVGAHVQVVVVEYRPFYISGAVANPGAYPFRPGITIRQAVARAGGIKILAVTNNFPELKLIELRAEEREAAIEMADSEIRLQALLTELEGKGASIGSNIPSEPGQPASELVALEEDQIQARVDSTKIERARILSAIQVNETQTKELRTVIKEREKNTRLKWEELQTASNLHSRGLLPRSARSEVEQEYNENQADLGENRVQLLQTIQRGGDLQAELKELENKRTLDLLDGIREASSTTASSTTLQRVLNVQ